MSIILLNRSQHVSDSDAAAIAEAMNKHLPRFCEAWSRRDHTVKYIAKAVEVKPEAKADAKVEVKTDASPASSPVTTPIAVTPIKLPQAFFTVMMVDDADVKEPADAYVPVSAVVSSGGKVLYGDSKTPTVAAYVSHEIYNAIVDRQAVTWVQTPSATIISGDVCDPVFDGIVPVKIADGRMVGLGNYVLPAWRDMSAAPDSRFDALGVVTKPFGISPGGTTIYMSDGGRKSIISGDKINMLILHHRSVYPSSRAQRRLAGPCVQERRSNR